MFSGASVFNQDLSDWDVSEGTDFVSDDQAFPSWRAESLLGTNDFNLVFSFFS
jgi:hypothetical protein